ncbi:hypothetical protein ACYFX5_11800 [Bremerella sp. T1]|uniref:hypothetical protein n=1 Tax=Bremerella sp. TYQ1 TaxID=3119568 RepID=UPI001CCC7074|nr:hypothetical protein [Bremerella volcania]UBM33756.1 hypothetical protein LA756_13745 [Bremerella volcania]
MELLIETNGAIRCVYDEALPLGSLGRLTITRGSHVEPTQAGQWTADLSPVNGPLLGPFDSRTAALAAEYRWLSENWIPHRAAKSLK